MPITETALYRGREGINPDRKEDTLSLADLTTGRNIMPRLLPRPIRRPTQQVPKTLASTRQISAGPLPRTGVSGGSEPLAAPR